MGSPTIPDWQEKNRPVCDSYPSMFSPHLPHPWSNSANGHLTAIGFHQHNSKWSQKVQEDILVGGSHVLKFQCYFWTKAGSYPTAPLNKRNKHLTGGRSLQCSWNPSCSTWRYAEKLLLLTKTQQVLYQELIAAQRSVNDPINSRIWDKLPRSQRILGHSCMPSKGHESWPLHRGELVGNSTQYQTVVNTQHKNSELLRICSLPTGCLAKERRPFAAKYG